MTFSNFKKVINSLSEKELYKLIGDSLEEAIEKQETKEVVQKEKTYNEMWEGTPISSKLSIDINDKEEVQEVEEEYDPLLDNTFDIPKEITNEDIMESFKQEVIELIEKESKKEDILVELHDIKGSVSGENQTLDTLRYFLKKDNVSQQFIEFTAKGKKVGDIHIEDKELIKYLESLSTSKIETLINEFYEYYDEIKSEELKVKREKLIKKKFVEDLDLANTIGDAKIFKNNPSTKVFLINGLANDKDNRIYVPSSTKKYAEKGGKSYSLGFKIDLDKDKKLYTFQVFGRPTGGTGKSIFLKQMITNDSNTINALIKRWSNKDNIAKLKQESLFKTPCYEPEELDIKNKDIDLKETAVIESRYEKELGFSKPKPVKRTTKNTQLKK